MQAIGIVGWKNSGKTTLITRLIPELRARGITASTIKHVHHEIDLDQPGKDTYEHRQAGAVDVVMYSKARWAILHERRDEAIEPADLDDVLSRMTPVDLVLIEGFKAMPLKKIEIRGAEPRRPVADDRDVIAIVAAGDTGIADRPVFGRDDIAGLADFVARYLGRAVPARNGRAHETADAAWGDLA